MLIIRQWWHVVHRHRINFNICSSCCCWDKIQKNNKPTGDLLCSNRFEPTDWLNICNTFKDVYADDHVKKLSTAGGETPTN